MILLVDNYDSFVYNLYQLIGSINPKIKVIRNDELNIEQIKKLNPSHIVLSPGSGKPSEAGICSEIVKAFQGEMPILGICLGHQVIADAGQNLPLVLHREGGGEGLASRRGAHVQHPHTRLHPGDLGHQPGRRVLDQEFSRSERRQRRQVPGVVQL